MVSIIPSVESLFSTFRATITVLGNLISFMTFQGTEILINFYTLYDVSGHDSHIRKFNPLYDVSGQRDLIKISIPFITFWQDSRTRKFNILYNVSGHGDLIKISIPFMIVWATIAVLGNLISFITFQGTEILLKFQYPL